MNEVHVKHGVSEQEYAMHQVGESLGHAPRIVSYDASSKSLITVLVKPMCIADMYGDKATDVPAYIWPKIKAIVKDLYKHGLEYVDITGYNFIEDSEQRVWIIDFGHCISVKPKHKPNAFVRKFISDTSFQEWNPDFR